MSVMQWTLIEEARFHLRSMHKGETIPQYITRTEGRTSARRRRLLASLIKTARKEAGKFPTSNGPRTTDNGPLRTTDH